MPDTRFHFVLGCSKQIGRLDPVYINTLFPTLAILFFFFSLPHHYFPKCPAPVPISLKSFLVRFFPLFLPFVSNRSSHHLPTSRCLYRARLQRRPSHQRFVDLLGFRSWYHPCPLHHFQVLSGQTNTQTIERPTCFIIIDRLSTCFYHRQQF